MFLFHCLRSNGKNTLGGEDEEKKKSAVLGLASVAQQLRVSALRTKGLRVGFLVKGMYLGWFQIQSLPRSRVVWEVTNRCLSSLSLPLSKNQWDKISLGED